ncbi:hypothetical protein TanjilG_21806 [Lupinus angustifolius]|uniref:Uncharacterized protein n=1 Tax=Lupinus angustifolius TaxID=3871 RepID=A0A394DCA6_LUPAN|nr:hypothetical protein TanjilG_21806 [Lupinus angustifolius]
MAEIVPFSVSYGCSVAKSGIMVGNTDCHSGLRQRVIILLSLFILYHSSPFTSFHRSSSRMFTAVTEDQGNLVPFGVGTKPTVGVV